MTSPTPPDGPGTDLRSALIRAARQILDEPDAALDLRKVAERAGKSRTAPYLVFGRTDEGGGLEALRLAVAVSGFEDLVDEMEEAAASAADSDSAVRLVAVRYLRFAQRHPQLFRVMFGPEVARAMRASRETQPRGEAADLLVVRARLERVMRQVVEQAQREGGIQPGDVYPLTLGAWAMFHGAAMLMLDGQLVVAGVVSAAQAAELTTRFLMEGAAADVAEAAVWFGRSVAEKGTDPEGAPAPLPSADVPLASLREETRESGAPRSRRGAEPDREDSRRPSRTADDLSAPPPDRHWLESPRAQQSYTQSVLSSSPALRRARRLTTLLKGSRVLWIDDRPEHSRSEQRTLASLGMEVVTAPDTGTALNLLHGGGDRHRLREREPSTRPRAVFDVVVSDIALPESPQAGIEALPLLRVVAPETPVVFYVGRLRTDLERPAGSFGITDDPGELLHLVLDALERTRI